MNLSDLANLFASQTLTTARRALRMNWGTRLAPMLDPVLLVQRAVISEGICEPTQIRITNLCSRHDLPLQNFLGLPAALQIVTDRGELRPFPFIITEAWHGRSDGSLTAIHLVGCDPMTLMMQRHRLRTFRRMSALQAACAVFDDWIANGLGGCFTYTLVGIQSDHYPARACFIQHPDESDTAFAQRMLREAGIAWCWRPSAPAGDGIVRQELVLFADGYALPANDSPSVRFHRRSAAEPSDTIDLLAPLQRLVPAGIELRSRNHEGNLTNSCRDITSVSQGEAGSALADALRSVRITVPHVADNEEHLNRLTRREVEHLDYRAHALHGRGSVRTDAAGTWQTITGHALLDSLAPQERQLITVRIDHFAQSNLPGELHAQAQALMGDEGVPAWAQEDRPPNSDASLLHPAGEHRYVNRFIKVRRITPIVPAAPTEPLQTPRPLTGIVLGAGAGTVGGDADEVLSDELARCWVQLVGGEPGADTTAAVRHLVPWGGSNHGMLTTLRAGTEVRIDFADGADRPCITGVHYNAVTPPPRVAHQPSLPANRHQTALVGREIGGTRQQHLLIDDTPGQLKVQIVSDHTNARLGAGWLSTDRNQGQVQPLGEGAELHSDAATAVRGVQGVYVSTEGVPGHAATRQLQRDGLIGQMQSAHALAQAAGELSNIHQAEPTDVQPQAELLQNVQDWDIGTNVRPTDAPPASARQPIVAVSGTAGVAIASQQSTTLAAGQNVDVVAQQHAQVTSGQGLRLRAMQMLSAFARQGMQLVVATGKLLMHAHDGDAELGASGNVHVYSTGGALLNEAKMISMKTPGASILMDENGVTITGKMFFKALAPDFGFATGSGGGVTLPTLPGGDIAFDERARVMLGDEPLAGRAYTAISRIDQRVLGSGVTDANGFTAPLTGVDLDTVRIVVQPSASAAAGDAA
jgi:type VI secretion system secreted protein VgrG